MNRYRHLLVGTDFSEPAEIAVHAAGMLAARLGARLTLVHAHAPRSGVPDIFAGTLGDLEKQVAAAELAALDQARLRLPSEVAVDVQRVEHRNAAAALTGLARDAGADLCVVGRHGATGLARLLIGSVAERVVRHAACDVLVVDEHAPDDVWFGKRIVVATDFSDASLAALDAAAWLAGLTGAELHLLHAFDDSVPSPAVGGGIEGPGETQSRLWSALSNLRSERFPQHPHVVTEVIVARHIADGIDIYAREHAAELIVIGAHGRTGIGRLLIGSVAERVVRHAPCSVLCARN
jgi:nucleotide-binding universal stress UspA family protein